jgi:hypothetical protein
MVIYLPYTYILRELCFKLYFTSALTNGNLFSLTQLIVSFLLQAIDDFPFTFLVFLVSCTPNFFFLCPSGVVHFVQDNYLIYKQIVYCTFCQTTTRL